MSVYQKEGSVYVATHSEYGIDALPKAKLYFDIIQSKTTYCFAI
jgi:hypothetical protein